MARISLSQLIDRYPPGLLVITGLAVLSTLYVALRPSTESEGRSMWTFVNTRAPVYEELIEEWGLSGPEHVSVELLPLPALQRRVLSGFFSGTPMADLLEVERSAASATWRGPIEAVGFVDLTERLQAEGLMEKINAPSFSPWTSRGHIFGLPADVHPVMLAYRADVFEAAGIRVEELDTWEKFFAATRRLVQDHDGDGQPDQYVMELQQTQGSVPGLLLLQAGGKYFDDHDRPVMDDPVNVRVLAHMASWASGPGKVTADLDLFTGAGHQLRSRGYVLSWVVPDWRAHHNQLYIESLAGKMKLMPLPAWEPGGRRTSSWGGTMLGIPKSAPDFEANWEFAKRLYLSRDLARISWTEFGVLTPVKAYWDDPIFDEANPYYSDQPTGRLFIGLAEQVPIRSSSPYEVLAEQELANALNGLIRYARETGQFTPGELEPQARFLLERANRSVLRQVERNVLVMEEAQSP